MVKYLIDSDVLINFLKGNEQAVQLLSSLKQEEMAISVISIAEILEGVVDSPIKLEQASNLLNLFHTCIINKEIAEIFAQLRSSLRKKGNLIDNMDLLIASTAIGENLRLITNNRQHFTRIKQLELYSA